MLNHTILLQRNFYTFAQAPVHIAASILAGATAADGMIEFVHQKRQLDVHVDLLY